MATIINSIESASLIESPTVVSVLTYDTEGIYDSSSLQHVCELYVWDGNKGDQPTTPSFTLKKFPITYEGGTKNSVFDVSPIISSFMSASIIDRLLLPAGVLQNGHNAKWWNVEIYDQAKNSSGQIITSSHSTLTDPRVAIQGYNKWGEKQSFGTNQTGSALYHFPAKFPFLTTAPDFQDIYRTDLPFYFSVYTRWDGEIGEPLEYSQTIDSFLAVGSNYGGITGPISGAEGQLTSSFIVSDHNIPTHTMQQLATSSNDYFTILLRDDIPGPIYLDSVIQPTLACKKKYTPQRILFRNRFGGFDQFDFNLVSRDTFNVETKTYHRSKTLPYGLLYDMGVGETTYISEGYKTLTVNTDYLSEEWNDFFEGMLLSEEIYLVLPPDSNFSFYVDELGANLIPLTVQSKTFAEKKEEVDKLIQYSFTFKYAVPHKLKL